MLCGNFCCETVIEVKNQPVSELLDDAGLEQVGVRVADGLRRGQRGVLRERRGSAWLFSMVALNSEVPVSSAAPANGFATDLTQ
jgi:hypothetical protein